MNKPSSRWYKKESSTCFYIKKSLFLIVVIFIFVTLSIFLFLQSKNKKADTWSIITPTSQALIIPKDWKEFSDTDFDFGIKTTIFLPPGCNFDFSGSEWNLGCGENDQWDYTSSVFRGKEENPENYYTGGSLRGWYQKYLNNEFFENVPPIEKDEIINLKEHSVSGVNYLEVNVKESYNKKVVAHYLYVQNNILHIIRPLNTNKLNSAIKKNISLIFSSLKSELVK